MFIKHSPAKSLVFIILSAISSPLYAGSVILGLNLEFVDGRFNDEAFDGGWGIHLGYEFKEWKS